MVSWDFVTFAAFLMQPDPKAFAVLGKVVLNFHVYDRTDTGKGVAHESNQSPIAQADDGIRFDRVQELTGLIGFKNGGLAALDDVPRPANGTGRTGRNDLAERIGNLSELDKIGERAAAGCMGENYRHSKLGWQQASARRI